MVNEIPQHETVFDTGRQRVAAVYAKALLGATEKSGNTKQVLDDLAAIVRDVLEKLPRFDAVLASPRIGHMAKERMLDSAFSGKVARELLNFLKVLARKGRLDCLRAISQSARDQFNELRGRVEVQLQVAHEIDEQLLGQIVERLKAALNKEIELKSTVDPALIGGMKVRVRDTVYDASVQNRLDRMHAETLSRTVQQIRDALGRFATGD